jgi:hypothetical protein
LINNGYDKDVATLGPSWNFSLTENLASLSLQDGLRSGIIISQSQPATSQPAAYFEILRIFKEE